MNQFEVYAVTQMFHLFRVRYGRKFTYEFPTDEKVKEAMRANAKSLIGPAQIVDEGSANARVAKFEAALDEAQDLHKLEIERAIDLPDERRRFKWEFPKVDALAVLMDRKKSRSPNGMNALAYMTDKEKRAYEIDTQVQLARKEAAAHGRAFDEAEFRASLERAEEAGRLDVKKNPEVGRAHMAALKSLSWEH